MEVVIVEDLAQLLQLVLNIVSSIDLRCIAIKVSNYGPQVGQHARLILKALFYLYSIVQNRHILR